MNLGVKDYWGYRFRKEGIVQNYLSEKLDWYILVIQMSRNRCNVMVCLSEDF